MASLISVADGNMSSNTKWKVASAGTRAIQSNYSASTDTTNAYVYNGNTEDITIANLEVIEGVMLFLCNKGDQTGETFYVSLSADSGTTPTREFQCDGVLIPNYPAWVFFKFSSSLTGDGGLDYAIGVKTTTAAKATVYRNATAQNWSHLLRTDQNPAAGPASAEPLYILGEFTAHDSKTAYTITMDEVVGDAIDHGTIDIGHEGNLDYDITAAHNPYMRVSGDINVWCDGDFRMGDATGGAVPSGSIATLLMDCTGAILYQVYIQNGGRFYSLGQAKQGTTKLTAQCSSGQKVTTVASTSGWAGGDTIVVASTIQTSSATRQSEERIIDTVDSATQVTVTVNYTYTHLGSSPKQAHVINCTRNVRIIGASIANATRLYAYSTLTTIIIQNTEFQFVGSQATAGIYLSSTNSTDIDGVAEHDCNGTALTVATGSGNCDINDMVIWNSNVTQNTNQAILIQSSSASTPPSIQNLTVIKGRGQLAGSAAVLVADMGLTFKNIVIADSYSAHSMGNGLSISTDTGIGAGTGIFGDWDTIEIYGGDGYGCTSNATGSFSGVIKNLKIWRNMTAGFGGNGAAGAGGKKIGDLVLVNFVLFGNGAANIQLNDLQVNSVTVFGGTIDADASYAVTNGFLGSETATGKWTFIDVDFGVTVSHTNDINIGTTTGPALDIELIHCVLSGVETLNSANLRGGRITQHYTDNSLEFTTYTPVGSINQDTTTRHTASGYSWKLTPLVSYCKLTLPGGIAYGQNSFKVAVLSGKLVTIDAYVYKDATYNGNAPRLVLIGGIVAGVGTGGTDTTDTLTVAHSNWEQLEVTGTPSEDGVLEFYIDCDGTAGNVYVDDITVSQAA